MSSHSSSSRPRSYFDGRLNLDQQKKRAKELLKSFRRGDADALARFALHHPRSTRSEEPRLADAQLVIARENGFTTWARLKSHCEALALKAQRIAAGSKPGLDNEQTLHIRCGSDIRRALEVAGFEGGFLEFADPFCQGPVPNLPLPEFIAARTSFVASAYGLDPGDASARMAKEYQALGRIREWEKAVLWFEHDAYDQLILAFLLHYFAGARGIPEMELICVDSVPGVPGFVGLGQLAPEVLEWLWEHERVPVSVAQLELGREVWEAYTAADLARLEILARGTPAVPVMAVALRRQLQELPSTCNGLGLTQQLILEILSEHGPMNGGSLFQVLMTEKEPLPFLGDLMFWHVLRDMGRAHRLPYEIQNGVEVESWRDAMLGLSETGKALLGGTADFLELYLSERWVGGVKITPGRPVPRWNPRAGAVQKTP